MAFVFYLRLLELYFAKTQEKIGFTIEVCPWLVVLAWHTNEYFVNTSREFWHLFFIFVCWNCTLPKLRKKLGLQLRSVPGSCCWLEYQWTWCLHEPWVLATYISCSGRNFFTPKLREKLDLQLRSVPGSCVLKNVYCIFAHFWPFRLVMLKLFYGNIVC